MFNLRDISADTFDPREVDCAETYKEGLVAMLAIGVALLVGVACGHEAAGAIAAGGARLRWGLRCSIPCCNSPVMSMTVATPGVGVGYVCREPERGVDMGGDDRRRRGGAELWAALRAGCERRMDWAAGGGVPGDCDVLSEWAEAGPRDGR